MKIVQIRILIVCKDGYSAITEFTNRVKNLDIVKSLKVNKNEQTIEGEGTFLKFTTSRNFKEIVNGSRWSYISFIDYEPTQAEQFLAQSRALREIQRCK